MTLCDDPGFGRPIRIREFNRPMTTDEAETGQTVSMMNELSEQDAATWTVMEATQQALNDAGIGMDGPADQKACAVFWWLKKAIRFVHVPGTNPLVDQTLIPPATLLKMPRPAGDCPQYSMLASAMLRVCCVPCHFKTIAADPSYPDTYSHVYNLVETPQGFLPFDSSHGPAPGSEFAQATKSRVWAQDPPNPCSKENRMLHNAAGSHRGFRNSTLRGSMGLAFIPLHGLGDTQCDDSGNCWTDGVLTTSAASTYEDPTLSASGTNCVYGVDTGGNCNPYPGGSGLIPSSLPSTSSSGSGANAYSLATALANDAAAVAGPLARAAATKTPTFITSPSGQTVLYNPNTGTFSGATSLPTSLSSISPTTLLIGAVVLGLIATMAGKK